MSSESKPQFTDKISHLKIPALILSILGVGLFVYFVYSVGINEILDGIGKIGFVGFAVLVFLYLLRIIVRAVAWKYSVYDPYQLKFSDTFSAVVIGEAVSSVVPLGILASGTAKAVAVGRRIPLVAGLSSVATENLFYTLVTSLFIIAGAVAFLLNYSDGGVLIWSIYFLIGFILLLLLVIGLMILQQWHWASWVCEWIYDRGWLRRYLEEGRLHVRLFENLIYGFYRRHPNRFIPIILCEVLYHVFGIAETWYILSRISEANIYNAFLLESVSRVVTIIFKLIPFAIGVDEASSQFITDNLELGVAVGVTIAILRKGRILLWSIIGFLIILKRGLTLAEILSHDQGINSQTESEKVVSPGQID
jgi:hypothetical protein